MGRTGQRIALVHATAVAMTPIGDAFAELWPEAELVNILDDSLSRDRAAATDLTPDLHDRIAGLARYAHAIGARAVLFTCSAFGPAIEAAAGLVPVPVLKPNEAMFAEALRRGRRIGMVATFPPSVATMEAEFAEAASRLAPEATIVTALVPEAMEALRSGREDEHNRLVSAAAAGLRDVDAVMLAQFSTARALAPAGEVCRVPVLSSPHAAVRKVRSLIGL